MRDYRFWGLGVIATLLISNSTYAQSIRWLGNLQSDRRSIAYDVSADGQVVVGVSAQPGPARAFRWTPQTGMQELPIPLIDFAVGSAVSADGQVAVGYNFFSAYRWTALDGAQRVFGLTFAWDVSANGSVIVGRSNNRAFRWTVQTGAQMLPTDPLGAYYAEASGVSADGSVVVGGMLNQNGYRVFRWTAQTGVQDLGTLLGYSSYSSSLEGGVAVSADGQVVVGTVYNPNQSIPYRAFRWTAQTGMQDIGRLSNNPNSFAYDVSGDGSIIVGVSGTSAFRWTANGGMEDLNQTYASLLTNGSALYSAYAISPDGRYIVGWGFNTARWGEEAFLLDTAPPPVWDETVDGGGDAGSLPNTAQAVSSPNRTPCVDAVTEITGIGEDENDVDMFIICITDPENFTAAIEYYDGSSAQPWLFRCDGTGVAQGAFAQYRVDNSTGCLTGLQAGRHLSVSSFALRKSTL